MSLDQIHPLKDKYNVAMGYATINNDNDDDTDSSIDTNNIATIAHDDDISTDIDVITSPRAAPVIATRPPPKKRGRKPKSATVSSAPSTSIVAAIASPAISDAAADRSRRRPPAASKRRLVGSAASRSRSSKRKATVPRHNPPLASVDDVVDNNDTDSLRRLSRAELVTRLESAEHVHAGATETIFAVGDLFIASRQFLNGEYAVDNATRKSHAPFDDGLLPERFSDARDDNAEQFADAVASHALAPVLGKRPNAAALTAHHRRLQRVASGASVYALTRSPNARSMAPAAGDLTDRAVAKMMTQVLRGTTTPTTVVRLANEIAPHFHPARLTDVLQRVHAQREAIFVHNASFSSSSSTTATTTNSAFGATTTAGSSSRRSSQR
jgi:hypothetical protein